MVTHFPLDKKKLIRQKKNAVFLQPSKETSTEGHKKDKFLIQTIEIKPTFQDMNLTEMVNNNIRKKKGNAILGINTIFFLNSGNGSKPRRRSRYFVTELNVFSLPLDPPGDNPSPQIRKCTSSAATRPIHCR